MSDSILLTSRFTDEKLDVIASIKIREPESQAVTWEFVIPSSLRITSQSELKGSGLAKPGEELMAGLTINLTGMSRSQIDRAKLNLIKVEITYGPADGSAGFKSDGYIKTLEQLLVSAAR